MADPPSDTLKAAHTLHGDDGLGIPEFQTAEIPMENDTFGFEVTAIACGLMSAAGALQHTYAGGSAFFVFPMLPHGTSDTISRHLSVITQGLQAYTMPHRHSIESYLTKPGYSTSGSGTEVAYERRDGEIRLTFDDHDRVVNINSTANASPSADDAPPASPAPPSSPAPASDQASSGGFLSRFRKK